MFRLYKRGRVWWAAFSGDDRVSTRHTDREAAYRWATTEDRRRADPAHAAAEASTVADGVRLTLADLRARGRSESTLTYYAQKLGHIARVLTPDAPLSAITARGVDALIAQRQAEGASQPELAKELGALRRMLRVVRRAGLYHLEPAAVLPVAWESGYTPRDTWLTWHDAARLLDELDLSDPARAAAVRFCLVTAARRSEVFAARREDVDLRAGLVALRGTKTKKARRVAPVVPFLAPMLRQALKAAGPDRLFAPWPNARRDILRACDRAGVTRVTWNDLRRSHAKWLRGRGVEPHLIAEVLGHATSKMAEQVYGRPSPQQLRDLLKERTKRRK